MTNKSNGYPEDGTVKVEKFVRNLRVKLTALEVAERADRAAHLVEDIAAKELTMKAAAKHAKARIEEVAAELRRTSTEVRDHATYRDIECERQYHYRMRLVCEVRKDTGEVVDERPMTERECQLELKDIKGEAKPALQTAKGDKPKGRGKGKRAEAEATP